MAIYGILSNKLSRIIGKKEKNKKKRNSNVRMREIYTYKERF